MILELVVRLDSDGKFLPLSAEFLSYGLRDVKHVKQDNSTWFAFIMGTKNQLIRGTKKPTGFTLFKMRQLQTIGYVPVLVSYSHHTSILFGLNLVKNFSFKRTFHF